MDSKKEEYAVINHMMRSRIRIDNLEKKIIEEFISKEEKYAPLKNFGDRLYLADRIYKFLHRHLFLSEPFKSAKEQIIANDVLDMANKIRE